MTTYAKTFGHHSFREEGDVVIVTPVKDAGEAGQGVASLRVALRAFVLKAVGEGFDSEPSPLRALLLTEDDVPTHFLDGVGFDCLSLGADGNVTIAPVRRNRGFLLVAHEAEVVVPFGDLLSYVLNDLCQVMAENIATANRAESIDILLSLLGGTLRADPPPGTGEARAKPPEPVERTWAKPSVAQRAGYEELRESLDELRDAASLVYSELAGTSMHIRGQRRLEEMREPMRRAFCVLNGIPFVPKPVDEDAAVEPYIRAIEAVMGRTAEQAGKPAP